MCCAGVLEHWRVEETWRRKGRIKEEKEVEKEVELLKEGKDVWEEGKGEDMEVGK